ncbi:MAG: rhodanese-like domain-containing protein [Sulfitobacter sp.]
MYRLIASAATMLVLLATITAAQEHLTEAKATFIFNGKRININRDNPDVLRLVTQFAATGTECGTPCIAPMQVAPGVATLDETQVLDFLVSYVAGNAGLMVDARDPEDRALGFIPGTVNLPYVTMGPQNPQRNSILQALGAREFGGVYNFTDARKLLVYDAGPSTNDAGVLIGHLIEIGYPPNMIMYYRGGMQMWSMLGFSILRDQS